MVLIHFLTKTDVIIMAGERILVVDDEANIIKALTRILTPQGYDVTAAYNGREGLEKVKQAHADGLDYRVILSDVKMPVMDGPQFIGEMLSYYEAEGVPSPKYIFLSGGMSEDQEARMKALNPFAVLPKPYSIETVLTTVKRASE